MNKQEKDLESLWLANLPDTDRRRVLIAPIIARIGQEARNFPGFASAAPAASPAITAKGSANFNPFELILAVNRKILEDKNGFKLTVNDIANALETVSGGTLRDSGAREQFAIASLGWTSMLFAWQPSTMANHCSMAGGASWEATHLHMEACNRTIGSFIRSSGLIPTRYSNEPRPEDLLYLSLLNFHSLTHVGRLRVEWTPHLTSHLSLHIPSRTLRLFMYPSLCILALLEDGNYAKLKDNIMHGTDVSQSQSLYREVLLSLKFILGQTRKSRRLAFRVALSRLAPEDRDPAFETLLGKHTDSLGPLSSLRPGPRAMKQLPDQEVLTPWGDLPLLGSRALELQRYNDQQRPTKTRNMIRDRRDPVKWYTLWAVLLIGGVSVVLSGFQLVISCAQLAYGIKAVS